jgi:GMP synthase (glutamine-hydrolysing)
MRPILVFQQVPHESLGQIEDALLDARLPWQTLELYAEASGEVDVSGAAGLVVLGGPMNVDEVARYPFLAQEPRWIREAIRRDLPVLGICLGAQLLAKALGARVFPNGIKEIGWYEIELTPEASDDELFGGCGRRQTVFQWHGDTFDLPSGAVPLAQSELCRRQAFRYGTKAYGLQFHLEVTPEMIDRWLDEPANRDEIAGLDYVDPRAVRAEVADATSRMRPFADSVLRRFAELCRGRAQ